MVLTTAWTIVREDFAVTKFLRNWYNWKVCLADLGQYMRAEKTKNPVLISSVSSICLFSRHPLRLENYPWPGWLV